MSTITPTPGPNASHRSFACPRVLTHARSARTRSRLDRERIPTDRAYRAAPRCRPHHRARAGEVLRAGASAASFGSPPTTSTRHGAPQRERLVHARRLSSRAARRPARRGREHAAAAVAGDSASPASRERAARCPSSPAFATWSRHGAIRPMPCRAQPSMIAAIVHCARTVAVLSDNSAGSGAAWSSRSAVAARPPIRRAAGRRPSAAPASSGARARPAARPSRLPAGSSGTGRSSTTCRRNSSHSTLKALS